MRALIFALTASALVAGSIVAGCSSSSSNSNPDIATNKAADFAMPAADLASNKFGCNGFITCFNDCLNGQSATFQGCIASCSKMAKNTSVATKYETAFLCEQTYCEGNADMGGYKCKIQFADGSTTAGMLVDNDGQPSGACNACLNNSFAALENTTCPDPSSPDCNPTACKTVVDACTNDLP